MWVLIQIKTNTRFYLLQDKARYLVSRNVELGDLTLAGDTSISRSHASLHTERNHVKLIDVGSRYGTFVNDNIDSNVPIEKHVSVEVHVNDRIRFGRMNNVWRLDKLDVVSFSSTLSLDEKKSLKSDLSILNGSLVSDWSDRCTHLTVSNITITLKVLQALSGTIPIVTPAFWKAFIAAARLGNELPKPEDFIPPVNEPFISNVVGFGINVQRRRTFANMEFIFMVTKHMERYALIIKLAGGKCSSMDTRKTQKSTLIKKGVCVVQYNPSTQSQTSQDIGAIAQYLRSKERRTIPECEIGLAILHCSTLKFCNPLFRADEEFQMPSLKRTISAVLAENTPMNAASPINVDVIVLETLPEESEAKPSMSMEPIILLDESMEVFSEKKTLNIPIDTKHSESGKSHKRCASPVNPAEHLPKRPASIVVDDFQNMSMQMLDDDNDLLDSISFNFDEAESGCDHIKRSKNANVEQTKTVTNSKRNPCETAADNESIPNISTQTTNSSFSGFLSKSSSQSQTTKTAKTHENQPKRKFNLLSTESDDDDDDALFKFDKNPVPIKRNKTNNSDGKNDSGLFAFSNTASQKLDSQKPPPKPKTILQANNQRPDSYLSRTINSMLNLSIQSVPITASGWLNCTTIKNENINECASVPKPDEDGSIDDKNDNKEWIKLIQNAFEVRVKKMNLVNRSHLDRSMASAGSTDGSIATVQRNFKAFVKKRNFHAQSTILKTVPSTTALPNEFIF